MSDPRAFIRGLYGIADGGWPAPEAQARRLAAAGACCVQLRVKGADRARLAALVEAVGPLGVPLIVNDHLGLGDGAHLGQGDGPFPSSFVGLRGRSTHTLDQLRAALDEGVDYVGFGPVWTTSTKVGALPARGLDALARAVALSTVPVVAIGGITLERLPELRATGVAAWAIISGIWDAPDPDAAARAAAR